VAADDAEGDSGTDPSEPARGSPLPPWIQPQTVRLVLSGLILVYLVGVIVDQRAFLTVVLAETALLSVVVVLFLLTLLWWEKSGKLTTKPRARVFLALAGLAILVQIGGIAAETSDPNDLANNAAGLLLLAILFFNTLG
jgi:hypothetical protein